MVLVSQYAAPFMGVDTSAKRRDEDTAGALRAPWFQDLYTHSNFSFLGVYLTHEPIPKEADWLYTNASCHVSNNWTKSWETLRQQGFGCWFIYAGYTSGESVNNARPQPFTEEVAKESGVRHAQHIKVAIAEFLSIYRSDTAGSTVFVDNEYGAIEPELKIYYNTLFDELRKPGPGDAQPVRPGLYARDEDGMPNVSEMLDDNPDLFIFHLDHHHAAAVRGRNGRMLPIPSERDHKLYLDPAKFDLRSFRRNDITSGRTIMNIPVGAQAFLNYGPEPEIWFKARRKKDPNAFSDTFPQMPTRALTRELTPVTPWDFNTSFVHDPRYPEASPRIRTLNNNVARGFFVKLEKRMEVRMSHAGDSPALTGVKLEPDAPLLLPDDNTLISLDTVGNPIMSTPVSADTWSPWNPLLSTPSKPPLRRLRAMTALTLPDATQHLFYIARDLSIQNLSLANPPAPWQGPTQWDGPTVIAPPKANQVHAFSNIATLIRNSRFFAISIFTISSTARLSMTTYTPPPSPNATPLTHNTILESLNAPPTLLLGSALHALSPHPATNLLFGISRSLRLTLFSSTTTSGWSTPQQFGNSETDKLFPHSRLTSTTTNPTLISIAAIAYVGDPVIFSFAFSAETQSWDLASTPPPGMFPVQYFPRLRTKPPNLGPAMPLGQGELDAREWSVNPWGDLCFGVDPSGTGERVLMCAGSGPRNEVGVLYRRVGRQNEDWYRVK